MTRRLIRRVAIFLGIIILFPLCYLAYLVFLQSDLYHSFHSVGDGIAVITTWLDTNANGIQDNGEVPLPNVCVGYVSSLDGLIRRITYPYTQSDRTDSHGIGGSDFLPGWTGDIYKYAFPPEGYQPTTDMVTVDYYAKFGFVEQNVKVSRKVETVNEYIRQKLIERGVRYAATTFFIFLTAQYVTVMIEKRFFNTGDTQNV